MKQYIFIMTGILKQFSDMEFSKVKDLESIDNYS